MNIRRAQNNQKDCNLVYNLSNEQEVRANSFNTALIEYSNHVAWYNRILTDENVLFFLLFEDNDFIGQIRFSRETKESDSCIISLSITKQFRGKGIGSAFLQKGIGEMNKTWPDIKKIIAEVKDENKASNALFIKEGFELISRVNTYKFIVKFSDGGGVILHNKIKKFSLVQEVA